MADDKITTKWQKPPHGAACNGCGLCCLLNPCDLGAYIFGDDDGRCPALEQTDSHFQCGLIAHPTDYMPAFSPDDASALSDAAAILVRVGLGCDTQLGDEPRGEGFDIRRRRLQRKRLPATTKALLLWGLPVSLNADW